MSIHLIICVYCEPHFEIWKRQNGTWSISKFCLSTTTRGCDHFWEHALHKVGLIVLIKAVDVEHGEGGGGPRVATRSWQVKDSSVVQLLETQYMSLLNIWTDEGRWWGGEEMVSFTFYREKRHIHPWPRFCFQGLICVLFLPSKNASCTNFHHFWFNPIQVFLQLLTKSHNQAANFHPIVHDDL